MCLYKACLYTNEISYTNLYFSKIVTNAIPLFGRVARLRVICLCCPTHPSLHSTVQSRAEICCTVLRCAAECYIVHRYAVQC